MTIVIAFETKKDFDIKIMQQITSRYFGAEATCVFLEDVSTIQATHPRFHTAVGGWSRQLIGQPMLKDANLLIEYDVDTYCLIASLDFIYTNLQQLQHLEASRRVIVPLMNIEDYHTSKVQDKIDLIKLATHNCCIVDYACCVETRDCNNLMFEIYAAIHDEKFIFNFIPTGKHPGAFGVKRRHHYHTGIDLYMHRNNSTARALEDGEVVSYGHFTGKQGNSPWWNDTHYIAIKHGKYVVVYGEILLPYSFIASIDDNDKAFVGTKIEQNDELGLIIPVTKKRHPEYEYHNNKMLHVELYNADTFRDAAVDEWELDNKQPNSLLDPYEYIKNIWKRDCK